MRASDTVLFVGGFKSVSSDGSYGGQVYACRSLIESSLKDSFKFVLFDTTSATVKPPPVYQRLLRAIFRIFKFIFILSGTKIQSVLIFTSGGFSFYEKGSMAIISVLFNKKVILAPRSGLIQKDVLESKFFHRFLEFVFQRCDVIICQGMEWKHFFQKVIAVDTARLVVVANWIDTAKYTFIEKELLSKCRLLYIGQFHPHKGLQDLLNAVLELTDVNYQLDIYGGGHERHAHEHFVNSNGLSEKVFFKGWADLKQKSIALAEADVLVLPSHTEGMPNVILEAMASGVAVIATRVGGVPSLINHAITGLLVEPNNPTALATAIRELVSHPEIRMVLAAEAYEKIKRENSIEVAVNCFYEILKVRII